MINYIAIAITAATLIAGTNIPKIKTIDINSFQTELISVSAQNPININIKKPVKNAVKNTHKTWVTAYTSRPEETDDTPFITASGNYVYDGVVAANFLPLGTRIRIPQHFGDRVFRVEDRMHERFDKTIDIWFEDLDDAKKFGKRYATIEIL